MLNRLSLNRIGLNRIGLNRIGKPSGGSSDRPYIDPKVLDSLCGVWIMDQNTNESESRNIIKNKIADRGGDLELLNFGYKLNSGYNGYPEDFTSWNYNIGLIVSPTKVQNNGDAGRQLIYYHTSIRKEDVLEFKVKITLDEQSKIKYWYIKEDGTGTNITYSESGTYTIPTSYFSKYTGENTWFGFEQLSGGCIIEQLPLYEGALVTDGKDDMIVSQKTVQEMGVTNEITVVSMIHQIGIRSEYNRAFNNYIRNQNVGFIRNNIAGVGIDKTGIYGYTWNNSTKSVINNILGDKNDYSIEVGVSVSIEGKFTVEGYINNGSPDEISEVAVYWTFIANKVLTTDDINQIIAYFKLDKYVTPQVIYDVKRQGLTNDTPAADWYLKDFSGNGHDMQLYNYAKTPESGINEEGGLQSDGVNDYGKAEGLPIFKDYTVVADRALIGDGQGAFMTKSSEIQMGAFGLEIATGEQMSFGNSFHTSIVNKDRSITYMSTYSYNGQPNTKGTREDGSYLCLATIKPGDSRFSSVALWSLLLFPYSLSEFLLERQLKKYKLGTLYPDMVEWRPIYSSNVNEYTVTKTTIFNKTGQTDLTIGKHYPIGSQIRLYVKPNGISDEVTSIKVNGVEFTFDYIDSTYGYAFNGTLSDKSPQKINMTIDEYIKFEDIVQPYPMIVNLSQDDKILTWGDKLKVGSEITVTNYTILLPELYTHGGGIRYNGTTINLNAPIIVAKSMVFTNVHTWKLNTTEPHAIYSPQKLSIPNSSLKILGYVPDLTGKGNHGKLNNFAYTQDSGVAADGSIKFDGTDDHITIPTLAHGGKCMMMKVNWSNESGTIYDQRATDSGEFAIFLSENNLDNEIVPAYGSRNNGNTYIDGILNTSILTSQLKSITHNITIANDKVALENTASPFIGCKSAAIGFFANMAMYEFMLFPEIPSEDEIKKLNDVMGIEGGYVESPNYYWDAYGKKNTDTDKNLIADQVSKDIANALEVKNVGYNSESGYNGYIELLFNKWSVFINENRAEIDRTDTTLNITKVYIQNKAIIYCGIGHYLADIPSKYKITGVDDTHPIKFGNDGFPNELILTVTKDGEYEVDWYNYGKNPCIMAGFIGDCNITIEQVAQYPNGLLLDGIEDHAINTVIPAVTDFTVIAKREWLDKDSIGNECFIHKGDINTPIGETAFILEYEIANDVYYRSSSYGGYINIERTNRPEKIVYQTPISYNGTTINKGSGTDTIGLILGTTTNNYWKGVFYKMMLYTKTIDQLSINMLKNLFEIDELINVTNPIFKKKEL